MSIRVLENEFKKIDIKDKYIQYKYNNHFYTLLDKSKNVVSDYDLIKNLCK
jgi:hypothetical protein